MVTNSDLQLWQKAVNGINESGKLDLSQEEWSALMTLNESLSSGNFALNESLYSLQFLKDNLSRHVYNRILQSHMQNFINLCDQYFFTGGNPVPITVGGNKNNQPANRRGDLPRKRNSSMLIVIVISVVCIAGYAIVKNIDRFSNFFSVGQTSDQGVIINGVKWATRNVDEVGTFASYSESFGKLYQWNRKKSFPNSWDSKTLGTELEWDDFISSGIKWEKENDPSPAGWRIPTYDEIASLLDIEKVSRKFCIQNSVPGLLFTDINTGNTLFFPVPNYLDESLGAYFFSNAWYWSNAQFATNRRPGYNNTYHSLYFNVPVVGGVLENNFDNINCNVSIIHPNENNMGGGNNMKPYFYSIRCVEDISPPSEVLINGVRWATCNVDDVGTFTVSPRFTGKLYQWNRKKSLSPSDGSNKSSDWTYPDWDKNYPSGSSWEEVNDPSPTGWRVPTKEELESLLDENKVSRKRFHEGGGDYGLYDFEGVLFTDKATGNTLLLPLTGEISNGRFYSFNSNYWSNTMPNRYGEVNENAAYLLFIKNDGGTYIRQDAIECRTHDSRYGYAIRSVRK